MSGPQKSRYFRFSKSIDEKSVPRLMNLVEQQLSSGIDHIILLISSTGGSVHWGITAYTFLKGIPALVDTHAFGRVNSVAIPLYCAGEHRYAAPNSSFLFHGVGFNVPQGARFDLKSITERKVRLENDTNDIARIIADNSTKTMDEIKDDMYVGKIITTNEATEYGIVHELREELFPSGTQITVI